MRELANTFGLAGALAAQVVPHAPADRLDAAAAEGLRQGLARTVAKTTTEAMRNGSGLPNLRKTKRDALDELIDRASSSDEEEQ